MPDHLKITVERPSQRAVRSIIPGSIVKCADNRHVARIEREDSHSAVGHLVTIFDTEGDPRTPARTIRCANEADAWAKLISVETSLCPVP